ncbi:hypothetical protein KY495_00030 [Massilia sp. PAMC28688]|uniref:hypothetical protein n=1 Tax=Massilia sp. PAMC28688 TaxID=2861283 RepID=UPI001C633DC6|nr:hypothetical protein [Massilia sp. PAMC28688]QYF93669.1 hypothetical protein KY495_00030 [Massilia sp. PAMC28688]
MDIYQKYFVSQHFGKSLSTVELGTTSGTVTLALARPESAKVKFSFSMSRLAQFVQDPALYPEMVTRIAIQQAHKLVGARGVQGIGSCELDLALETSPWIGDLTDIPYGGATSGYETVLPLPLVSQACTAAPAPG